MSQASRKLGLCVCIVVVCGAGGRELSDNDTHDQESFTTTFPTTQEIDQPTDINPQYPILRICKNSNEFINHTNEIYSMGADTYKIFELTRHTTVIVNITDIDPDVNDFLVIQAHSQNHYLILSHELTGGENFTVNSTDPALVAHVNNSAHCHLHESLCLVYLTNCNHKTVTVLFMVRNYTHKAPVPGRYKAPGKLALPYLTVEPNILTTHVSYRAAGYPQLLDKGDGELCYETFLTYMYERDLSEANYWSILIATSTLEGLSHNAKSVGIRKNNETAEMLGNWFVSYSGVGAVVTVVVSYNNSNGSLYSSAVSYGCDFIEAEEYRCTKLVTSMAKFFCASLLFIGAILLLLGHRWLNFTMFFSGFFFFWCIIFILFAGHTSSSFNVLQWGTLVGAVLGGLLWLYLWHKFRRPFHSALLIIVMAVIFLGMVTTFFLRYAISPVSTNISAFVVFPVFLALVIIGYSIVNIKKVHIFSCTVLGSYAFVVPFAFYFGSSLTYIVINVVGLLTVEHYSEALGYPPFQVCDIILLCVWVVLFIVGMVYQLYRERSSPPFHPPNLASWNATKKFFNFLFDKLFACLPLDPDCGGAGIEDRPTWVLRITYTSKLLHQRLTCAEHEHMESGYQSFHRVRTLSQSAESLAEPRETRLQAMGQNLREWMDKIQARFTRRQEGLLQEAEYDGQEDGDGEGDESELADHEVRCCSFGKSQVVLDDAYTEGS